MRLCTFLGCEKERDGPRRSVTKCDFGRDVQRGGLNNRFCEWYTFWMASKDYTNISDAITSEKGNSKYD